MTRRHTLALGWGCLLCYAHPVAAELPAFLRKENSHVRDGNEQLNRGDAKAALESYTRAARELPDAPGVLLDRGLALLKQAEFAKAREALLGATQPSAPSDLRADAYEDLALSFYREADGLATQNKHEEAQKLFRESVDAAKRSLRLRPGDPNTAWNLELAARRVREEQEKQKQEDEKKKQEQKDQKDQDQKDQNKSQDQNSDPDQQKSDGDNKQQPDAQNGDQKEKPADKKEQPQPDKDKKDQEAKGKDGQDKQDKQDKKPETKPADQDPSQQQEKPEQALPPEATQALDALEGGEENFERYRARQRAARERRAPEKDW